VDREVGRTNGEAGCMSHEAGLASGLAGGVGYEASRMDGEAGLTHGPVRLILNELPFIGNAAHFTEQAVGGARASDRLHGHRRVWTGGWIAV
jgi:hypothetical protein